MGKLANIIIMKVKDAYVISPGRLAAAAVMIPIVIIAIAFYINGGENKANEILIAADKNDTVLLAEAGENADIAADALAENVEEIPIVVDVAGAVAKPSVVFLPEGSRVYEAIELAGGLSEEADMTNINQAAVLNDGDRLYIPAKGDISSAHVASSQAPQAGISGKTSASSNGGADGRVNINTSDSQGLQKLNGVGPSTAEKIIRYREENGAFRSIEDIKNVSGIGAKTFEKLRDYITV